MTLLPKSRKARRRLAMVALAAPILGAAVGLTLYAMRNTVSLFYSPAEAHAAHVRPGQPFHLGGLVAQGSVVKRPDGSVDLFREGQGVVTQGAYRPDGVFVASEVLAKHDEKYMPPEVTKALKKSGEWRGDEQQAARAAAAGGS
jgi:cytochrome c-type biogenesis protein CcmE